MDAVTPKRANEIVVAVDGSRPSLAALSWAVREARTAGRDVCAVRVFDPAYLYSPPGAVFESIEAARAAEREVLREEVAGLLGAVQDVRVREELLEGQPAAEIVRRSEGAAMLVMGSHGRTRIGSTFLGSVGRACVRKAGCPVVVIPPNAAEPVLADSAAGSAEAPA
ncbi:universal stress protein [Pseudonocardia endophytica]|uniref:Nucleotide-binding universal stress UspA family protein n=1 Tax=Pseudonocardia endophytica TaxID=401976 RepID=A0A4R1HNY5_PSEEN|nr:universal stress protein [Pseudonocardia endophytica]TCK22345.1 nucleotide-binding universal stress UspA family protein [Pseudonocardia endophytica]